MENIMDNDKILYQDFLNGNQRAFEKIMDQYSEKLIYFIFRFVKDIEIAKDLSQDVFVYILLNKEKYNFKYSLKTYIWIIARSKSLDYLKREKRRVEFKEDYLYQNELLIDVEQVVFDSMEKKKVRELIKKLDDLQRKNDIFSRS